MLGLDCVPDSKLKKTIVKKINNEDSEIDQKLKVLNILGDKFIALQKKINDFNKQFSIPESKISLNKKTERMLELENKIKETNSVSKKIPINNQESIISFNIKNLPCA